MRQWHCRKSKKKKNKISRKAARVIKGYRFPGQLEHSIIVSICTSLGWKVKENGHHTFIHCGDHNEKEGGKKKGCRLPSAAGEMVTWHRLMGVFGSQNGFGKKKQFQIGYLKYIGKL